VTRKVFLILLALALALSVGLVACAMPAEEEEEEEEQPELWIYLVRPVEVESDYVESLASVLFPIGPVMPQIEQTDDIYYASLEPYYYLECCKNSGSVWYADESQLYNELYVPEELPSEDAARDIADDFLESIIGEMIPEPESVEYEFFDIGETKTITSDPGTDKTETVINHLDVLYSFGELDGIPVEGPGAKIRVSIGDDGEVIGLHYVWREVEQFEAYPAITEEEAREIFEETSEAEFETLEVKLGYYAESEYEKQDFLQPYYIFDGTMLIETEEGEEEVQLKTQLIPATTFSPIARIVSPDYDAESLEGEMIDFEASVSGGAPPYDYVWESDVDGVIGTEASFSSDLSVAARDEEVSPHTITLQVTDANGNLAMAIISVEILPIEPMSILAMAPAPEAIQSLSTNSPNDDANDYEVGIEYVNNYPNHPLHFCGMDAKGFRNELTADGWVSKFTWGNSNAWEKDFKYRDSSSGEGIDYLYIDAVDFAYFAGQGSPYGLYFSSEVDRYFFRFERARWGGNRGGAPGEEGDLEWIVLDAGNTLREWADGNSVVSRWDQAFDGLHYVFGFDSRCRDSISRGRIFARNMKQDRTIRQSWIRATQATEGSSHRGAYLRRGSWPEFHTLNDHLPGHGYVSPDPPPGSLWGYMSWSC
jgi:hypothetical protein